MSFFLSKYLKRNSWQSGDKTSGNMMRVQDLRLQTACKKFLLEAVAKELWKIVICLKILVASCSILSCNPRHSLPYLPAPVTWNSSMLVGLWAVKGRRVVCGPWRWKEGTGVTITEKKQLRHKPLSPESTKENSLWKAVRILLVCMQFC